MDYNIDLIHLHVVEEMLRYVEKHGDKTTYDGLINHLLWYWKDHKKTKNHRPQGWVCECARFLSGEL